MLRRLAITVAAIATAGFMAAGPAAAASMNIDGGHAHRSGCMAAGFEYSNVGGPYGITAAKGGKSAYESESAFGGHDRGFGHHCGCDLSGAHRGEGMRAGFEYLNIGGPFGITETHRSKSACEWEAGFGHHGH
ncbi:hypothetical protein [Streptomyces sp. H27-C3]|uniref:hypothetical protein n=1 Tax=Streptomyces sp. H27-C3 TaxID=3046305 RepID=UPI0024BA56CA|nr:hypothetical protein [Streptomyces sp. H27-C3]MDJ0466687.1 hypothetical protein [Streptomyces sp. H27-C3]